MSKIHLFRISLFCGIVSLLFSCSNDELDLLQETNSIKNTAITNNSPDLDADLQAIVLYFKKLTPLLR